jgi:hypothetical protein
MRLRVSSMPYAALQLPLLAVKRAVVAELLGEEVGTERGSQHAAGKQAGGERRGEGNGVDFVFADVGEPLDDLKGEGGGLDVEALAGFLTEQAELVGRGEHFGVDDFAHDGGQAFEGFAQLAGAGGAGFGRANFSRRWSVGPAAASGFFASSLRNSMRSWSWLIFSLLGP